jgi:phosphopantetheine adenylyltransferase
MEEYKRTQFYQWIKDNVNDLYDNLTKIDEYLKNKKEEFMQILQAILNSKIGEVQESKDYGGATPKTVEASELIALEGDELIVRRMIHSLEEFDKCYNKLLDFVKECKVIMEIAEKEGRDLYSPIRLRRVSDEKLKDIPIYSVEWEEEN